MPPTGTSTNPVTNFLNWKIFQDTREKISFLKASKLIFKLFFIYSMLSILLHETNSDLIGIECKEYFYLNPIYYDISAEAI